MRSVRAFGDEALLVTDVADPAALVRAIEASELTYRDVAAGADSVLVVLHRAGDAPALWSRLSRLADASGEDLAPRDVVITVTYDGPDLQDVAELTGLSEHEVIALHASTEFMVAFCGFAPGFAYLTGLPAALHVPRLATPRSSVPAGSVAIAAQYSGVYPRSSPGGWRILGTTGDVIFDEHRAQPALLLPGDRVRFVSR